MENNITEGEKYFFIDKGGKGLIIQGMATEEQLKEAVADTTKAAGGADTHYAVAVTGLVLEEQLGGQKEIQANQHAARVAQGQIHQGMIDLWKALAADIRRVR
jgi:hypothetical protein